MYVTGTTTLSGQWQC